MRSPRALPEFVIPFARGSSLVVRLRPSSPVMGSLTVGDSTSPRYQIKSCRVSTQHRHANHRASADWLPRNLAPPGRGCGPCAIRCPDWCLSRKMRAETCVSGIGALSGIVCLESMPVWNRACLESCAWNRCLSGIVCGIVRAGWQPVRAWCCGAWLAHWSFCASRPERWAVRELSPARLSAGAVRRSARAGRCRAVAVGIAHGRPGPH